ncbi:MAG: integrase [Streptomycetales bacterium]
MHVSFATEPSGVHRANEDFVAATPNAAVLLDGAGSGSESGCVHGVPWFVRRLGASLLVQLTHDEEASVAESLAAAIYDTRRAHAITCDLDHPGSPSATVVVIRSRGSALDYLVLADSVLVLDLPTGPYALTDDRQRQLAQHVYGDAGALQGGAGHGTAGQEHLESNLLPYRNRPGGFWVAASDPAAAGQAVMGTVGRAEVKTAALLSDGVSRLVDSFGLAGWPDALATLASAGPDDLVRRVRAAEVEDRDGYRWPRAEIHDDATVAHCTDLDQ